GDQILVKDQFRRRHSVTSSFVGDLGLIRIVRSDLCSGEKIAAEEILCLAKVRDASRNGFAVRTASSEHHVLERHSHIDLDTAVRQSAFYVARIRAVREVADQAAEFTIAVLR